MELKDFLLDSGRVNSSKIKEINFKRNFIDEYWEIIRYSEKIGLTNRKFTECFYHWINKLDSPIFCKNCKTRVSKFLGITIGYLDYCSSKCSNGSKDVQESKKKKWIETLGVENPSHSKDVINKIKNTFDERFGGNPFSIDSFKDKIKNTCLEKYGTTSPLSNGSSLRIEIENKKEKEFFEKYKELEITYYNPDGDGECRAICDKCNKEYEISKWNLHQRVSAKTITCTFCNPIGSDMQTFLEAFIKEFLDSNKFTYIEKDRKLLGNGKEIDFYIDSHKIGIETNGIYWHSDKFKGKQYHKEKTDILLSKGIKLIHIFEDEVLKKPDIVISRLSSIFGVINKRIYARNCIIKYVGSKDAKLFLDKTHLQGNCVASTKIGLYYNDQLVSIMTFGKNRRSLGSKEKDNEYELIRFSNELNTSVIGAASRLLKFFIKEKSPKKIISFCDRRWSSDGIFYEKLGFKFLYNTNSNYWYYKKNTYDKNHRYTFRKDILVKNGEDPNKTEFEIMNEKGYIRVYDSGSSKWEMLL